MSCQGLVRIGLSVISISANGMIEHMSTINYWNSGEETWMEVLKKKSKDKSYYQSKIKIKAIGF